MVSFLKRGKEAYAAMKQSEAEAEIRKASFAIRRFWLPIDGETQITFLDGELDEDGDLFPVHYKEHQVRMNGHWRNWFVCIKDKEPCPVCADGHHPSDVCVFTVIDHSRYTDKQGKQHQHERRLFVAKRDTFKRLAKGASKRGGLVGWTINVSRTGQQSAAVGTDFDFLERNTLPEIQQKYGLKPEECQPYEYEPPVIPEFTAEQLRELGFGGGAMVGAGQGPSQSRNYEDDL